MQDKLLKACFIVSLLGILLLMFLSEVIQPKLIEIYSINGDLLEKSISVRGIVASERNFDDFKVLELCDNSSTCILVTLNSKDKNNFTGKDIFIFGKLTEYKNELQINANLITDINK